ncbi:MAG: leucine-rich repeat protein [Prevotella sp.]|uniref:leucine-rich repeat domain-containing protein n=1 Tax=Prevotella sp. TaxID=59823 RepID=UPI002A31082A|nr:leucine-rich repeat protein [Prevotella sp.]MDD7317790.1 leucine-rich repeat protein [Prevotellaceae bacterium]MDY4020705.1 leucine-rich repeat protein [Prevotella sp.]
MRKLFFMLCSVLMLCSMAKAQTVENGVLTSWDGARGMITIPDGVTEIVANCFYQEGEADDEGWEVSEPVSNTDITGVNLNNVTKIGKNAFRGCTGITVIQAPNVQNVGEASFYGCDALTEINLPAIVTLGKDAFSYCTDVTSISLGNTLTTVIGNPFKKCDKVQSMTMTDGGAAFHTVSDALLRKSDAALIAFAGAKNEVSLDAETCKIVGEQAFQSNTMLKKVNLPGVTVVGSNAFNMCSSLTELYLPRLVRVNDDSFTTFNGVGSLSVIDIHLSENFETFGYSLADKSQTTIYVASETIKTKLQKEFSKCNIVVGEPAATKKYKVTFSATPADLGTMEAWTTGAVDVQSGQELYEGSMVKIKAIPLYGNRIAKWTVNGNVLTEPQPTEGTNGQIYTIDALQGPVDVVVTFEEMPAGYVVFFKSMQPGYGTITCKTQDGKEVKTAEEVPVGSVLTFTATPFEGYHVTEWYHEVTAADNSSSFEIIEGQYGKTTYTCEAYDMMDIRVDFERNTGTNVVKFKSLNEYGTVTAAANGVEISTGTAVASGSKVVFTAHPQEGYKVDSWLNNNELIVGFTGNEYVIENLNADVEIDLVCSKDEGSGNEHLPVVENGHLVKWLAVGEAVVGDTITAIDERAFEGANEMTKVTIGKNVATIGELPFLYCTRLTAITVDPENKHFCDVDGVVYNKEKTEIVAYPSGRENPEYTLLQTTQTVRPGAFAANFYLEGVKVPTSEMAIASEAGALYSADRKTLLFQPITAGEELAVKEGVESIARLAIAFSPVFKKVFFPASLKRIESLGMGYNMMLAQIGWQEGVAPALETIGNNAFERDMSLLQLPYIASLKTIGSKAFLNVLLMEEAHIPAGCTLSPDAFEHCVALMNVYAYAMQPQDITDATFQDIENIETATLHVPEGTAGLYKAAPGWRRFNLVTEDIASGITSASASDGFRAARADNGILVEGVTAGEPYALYSVTGQCLAKGTARTNSIFVPMQRAAGMIIVKVGTKTLKVW